MRVTQGMLSQDLIRQLNNSTNRLSQLYQQLYTGKKISKPSDDPVIATLGIGYRTEVNQVDQYTRNMDEVHKWMDSSDSALKEANDVLQRIRDLIVEASNDSYSEDQRVDAEKEIEQLKKQLGTIANTQVAGKYIFNGTNTTNPPVTVTDGDPSTVTINYDPNNVKNVNIEVSPGIKIGVNVNPANVFSQQLFDDLDDLENTLKGGGKGTEISGFLDKIDGHLDNVSGTQAELGAIENRVDLIDNRLSNQKQLATDIMAKNEDADFEKTLIDYLTQQNIHQAALSVGSRIIQPTLVDFLR
ncbi:flagellar hook-associated protein FlgL [Camelliibacillus cellulosilyticus]|uniref:Flagellar hook-associated protein FlgL n=1 Tax=Camelliibacillus cellulosilyticus TaxID=2174486 RepID=A0ABV9GK64_9BACL